MHPHSSLGSAFSITSQASGSRSRTARTRLLKASSWTAVSLTPYLSVQRQRYFTGVTVQSLVPLRHGRALGAVKHSILCACWHVLTPACSTGTSAAITSAYETPKTPTRRLVAQHERLDHKVSLEALLQAAGWHDLIPQPHAPAGRKPGGGRRPRLSSTQSARHSRANPVAHRVGTRPDPGVDDRQLALPPAAGLEVPLVEVSSLEARAERGDCLERVDCQLS